MTKLLNLYSSLGCRYLFGLALKLISILWKNKAMSNQRHNYALNLYSPRARSLIVIYIFIWSCTKTNIYSLKKLYTCEQSSFES